MKITLRFRSDRGRGRDGPDITVPIGFLWFEGVNDLHIQFDGPGEANYCPPVNPDGDYMAPHPKTGRMTALYSLEVGLEITDSVMVPAYIEKLKAKWPSPNT